MLHLIMYHFLLISMIGLPLNFFRVRSHKSDSMYRITSSPMFCLSGTKYLMFRYFLPPYHGFWEKSSLATISAARNVFHCHRDVAMTLYLFQFNSAFLAQVNSLNIACARRRCVYPNHLFGSHISVLVNPCEISTSRISSRDASDDLIIPIDHPAVFFPR